MEECLIGTGEACSDKTVFNYVFLSTLVFTILSRTFVSPFMAALSTGPAIEKKAKLSI